ncbi:unnamed protein product [Linum trigynum]|uniref:CCHC-type domain-containing protein n=1 Tax=Linum trigynum TaxID=586398 RepID=A0AAV2EP17_9ROSI
MATFDFTDYAARWWEELQCRRQQNQRNPVATWEELRGLMREKFVPANHKRELYEFLQGIRHGVRSMEEFFRELELLMMCADVREDREVTIARFLHGLNRDIRQEVDLRSFVDLEEVLHLAIKVEKQHKSLRRPAPTRKPAAESNADANTQQVRPEPAKLVPRNTNSAPLERSGGIQCFKCHGRGHKANQCPNMKTLIVRDDLYLTDDEHNSDDSDVDEKLEVEPALGKLSYQ